MKSKIDDERRRIDEIRKMFLAFRTSYDQLPDKSGIDWELFKFPGWLSIANDRYEKRLLAEWRHCPGKENLTRDDFLRIQKSLSPR
jgi:hypothetical protein